MRWFDGELPLLQWKSTSKNSGVYAVFCGCNCLYVGQTDNIRVRLQAHVSSRSKVGKLILGGTSEYTLKWAEYKKENWGGDSTLYSLESYYANWFHPSLNAGIMISRMYNDVRFAQEREKYINFLKSRDLPVFFVKRYFSPMYKPRNLGASVILQMSDNFDEVKDA